MATRIPRLLSRSSIVSIGTQHVSRRPSLINPQTLSAVSRSSFRCRAMATEARKHDWLVVVPDKPGTLAKRLEVRPEHFANMNPKSESGQWKMGGAILSEPPETDDPSSLKFIGSTLVVVAATKEEVMEQLRADIYVAKGVWDLDKVQIWPMKTAFRNP